jgi:hypothetical protein
MSKSKFLKLQNTKLSNYIELKTNRVLQIDDISSEFSSAEDSRELFSNVLTIDSTRSYNRFLVQIIDSSRTQYQLAELITLSDDNDIYTLTKGLVTNKEGSELIADVYGFVDGLNNMYLRFEPTNPNDFNYDIKILKNEFVTRSIGINTVSIGYVDLFANNSLIEPLSTENILSLDVNEYSSVYASLNVINTALDYKTYVEIYLTHDGENTYLSEFYFDDVDQYNGRYIGTFTSYISGGLLKLDFVNDSSIDTISVRTRNVGFGSTSIGSGIYRFKSETEPDGFERSATYESNISYTNSGNPGTVISLDKSLFTSIKSLVKVGIGSTTALHQLLTVHDGQKIQVAQYPFLSIGSTSGIGTFGGEYSGNNIQIKFYPDSEFNGNIEILSFNENIYTFLDFGNEYPPLEYLPNRESLETSTFFGTNLEDINKTDFVLKYEGTPIFSKRFNPSSTSVLNKETGTFNIRNHFFSTGEELIYTPKSSFLGIGATAVGIGQTLSYTGSLTSILPDRVYAIKLNNDQFKIATRKEYAQAGIFVTFTSNGEGNAHEFEMIKKNEKSLISINDLTQYPLAYTSLSYVLTDNGGQISTESTIFSLSGISSISPTDLLKVNDEFMYVTNVGVGTTSNGPITFEGSYSLVEVNRGYVGTSATFHLDGDEGRIYRGSYNIVGNEIHFTNPPRGSSFYVSDLDFSNLRRNKATFNGRVFLRNNYDSNVIYDNISEKFTGLDQDYTVTVQGINTVGLGTSGGNGIVFLNGIFQTPTTLNNTNNNFEIIEDTNVGITSIVFTGITDENGNIIISESDVNQNQLPRGGLIVSLGSTPGLGYAPLVGAKVIPILNSSGSIVNIVGTASTGNPIAFSTVSYNNENGILDIFTQNVSLLNDATQVKLVGLAFTCPSNPGIVSYFPSHDEPLNITSVGSTYFSVQVGTSTLPHNYVGFGTVYPWYSNLTFGSGYRNPVSIAVTEVGHVGSSASISATVGAGGTLSLNILSSGTGYTNPSIIISPPSYEYLPVVGVSRLGIGNTTDTGTGLLLNVEVGASSTSGIGSTTFEVTSFKVARNGYGFRRGDIFKPVGLVTAKGLSQPISEFQLTVLDVFNDSFAAWQFGELNYIDSIKNFQDGSRTRFPLFYNSELLSFEINPSDQDSQLIDLDSLLIIFVNGILQVPGESYQFNGGTSFTFTLPPKPEDNISIFFYLGTRDEDSVQVNVNETLRIGDEIQVLKNNELLTTTITQERRIITDIAASDRIETAIYTGPGVDDINQRPLSWIKQKRDVIINGENVSKSRDLLESQIYPTSRVIKSVDTSTNEIFLDNVTLFEYDNPNNVDFDLLLYSEENENLVTASVTPVVSVGGSITDLVIDNAGSGYIGTSIQVKFSKPLDGTVASASLSVSDGQASLPVSIISSGSGYDSVNLPQTIVEAPRPRIEYLSNCSNVIGYEASIVSINTCPGIGTNLGLKFELYRPAGLSQLQVGYPIYVFGTYNGNGTISIISNDSEVLSISTNFTNNIYYVSSFDLNSGIATCNILSTTNVSGIETSGTITSPVGKMSWGRISGFSRSENPISLNIDGNTSTSGLSTYPIIQRRGYGLRETGSIKKAINSI